MKNLALLRKKAKMNQLELAEKLGVSQQTISKYENGTREPDHTTILKLSEIFNVSTDYLLGKTDNTTDEQYYLNGETRQIAQEIKDNPELRALFDASRNATPEDLEITKDILLKLKRKEQGRTD